MRQGGGRYGKDDTVEAWDLSSLSKTQRRVSLIKKRDDLPCIPAIAFSHKSWSVLEELRVWVKIYGRNHIRPARGICPSWPFIKFKQFPLLS